MNTVGSPRTVAVLNCKLLNKLLETVAEPDTNAPSTPINGDIKIYKSFYNYNG